MDCMLRQDDEHVTTKDGNSVLKSGHSGQINSVKLAMCPMKYAGAGMDFVSGMNNLMGVQNSRMASDFQMMFGAAPSVGSNPYGNGAAHAPMNPFSMFAPQPAVHPATRSAQPMYHPASYGY